MAAAEETLRTEYTLTLTTTAGTGTLEGAGTYTAGTVVKVTAIPGNGYRFDHWGSDTADNVDSVNTVVMDADKTISAVFSPPGNQFKPGMPNLLLDKRENHAAATLNGVIYVISGMSWTGSSSQFPDPPKDYWSEGAAWTEIPGTMLSPRYVMMPLSLMESSISSEEPPRMWAGLDEMRFMMKLTIPGICWHLC